MATSLDASSINSTQGSSPHHQVAIQSSLDLPKKLEFDQTFRYVSSLPAQLVGAYTTADVRFSWHATRSLDVSVVGQNLFQPHHAEFRGVTRFSCRDQAKCLHQTNVAIMAEIRGRRSMELMCSHARGQSP